MRSRGANGGTRGGRARARGGQGWGQGGPGLGPGGARAGARGGQGWGQGWGQGGPWPPWPPRWLGAWACNGLGIHCYADDGQLYFHGKAGESANIPTKITNCIEEIDGWMSSNRLKVNSEKHNSFGSGQASN